MRKRAVLQEMTHEELATEMERFLAKGGKIKLLPKQQSGNISVIGAEKWDAYESLSDLNF